MVISETTGEVLQVSSLREYFRESMDAALVSNHVTIAEDTAHYVVCLLAFYARADALYEAGDEGRRHRALAAMMAEACEADSESERHRVLQRIGDVALFVSGFLAGSLDRAPVGVGYYIDMGGGAYQTLATGVSRSARGRSRYRVFSELARKFRGLVDVLNEMRESGDSRTSQDTRALFEHWHDSGSPRAERLLESSGVSILKSRRSRFSH